MSRHAEHSQLLIADAKRVREDVVNAVRAAHPAHRQDIADVIPNCVEFLTPFSQIFTDIDRFIGAIRQIITVRLLIYKIDVEALQRQVLRSLVLTRVKNWDYRELRERIADGLTLRQFTDFYCDPVPKHDAFNRGFNRLTPATLKAVNDLLVQAAVALGLEDGAKLRVDTTVVETDIHHPTDNTLLWDVVRVVSNP
jgi:Transposase domain (DUF772)